MNANPNKARDIFAAALKLTPDQWDAYLEEACGDDHDLRCRVRNLLEAHRDAGSFLEAPAHGPVATVDEPAAVEQPGTVIGPYKLLQQIGEGGMGTVFMAEQTHPIRRKVALKVIKAGMDSGQVIARFEAERQALAMMDHVNIARVFDGGTWEEGRGASQESSPHASVSSPLGPRPTPLDARPSALASRPYFVMELVHGVPITKYCDDNHLTPRERLELFVPVCQAIQHAHQKGIIHRDIKPSNVMVTLYDGKPVPKVIDFGVAKATEQKLTERSLFTQYGTMIGTLEYMSPEQAEMSALGVDTRSDIYSLGVLLYELLTGSTPLTHKRMKEAAYAEILRMIKEEEPPKPSTRLSDSGEALASISANRHTEPAKLTKLVRGELDWIVMKCLEKDRNRRYETANGFAMDVQRYLADEPVLACPPSVGYRLRKFARRNKRLLTTAGILGVAVLVVAGTLGWTMRDRAARRTILEQAVVRALEETETASRRGRLPEASAALKRAEELLTGGECSEELGDRVRRWRADLGLVTRLLEARMLGVQVDLAKSRFRNEVTRAEYEAIFRDHGMDPASVTHDQAAHRIRGLPAELQAALLAVLDDWAALRRGEDPNTAPNTRAWLKAVLHAVDADPWRAEMRAALEKADMDRLVHLAGSPDMIKQAPETLNRLGGLLCGHGKLEQGLVVLRRAQQLHPADFWINTALAIRLREAIPQQHAEAVRFASIAAALQPDNAGARLNLGLTLDDQGQLEEAITAFRQAIALKADYPAAHSTLGHCLLKQGKLGEAIAACREAIRLQPGYSAAHTTLAIALAEQGKLEEALAEARKAVKLKPCPVEYRNLGTSFMDLHKFAQAESAYRQAIALEPKNAGAHMGLGNALREQGKLEEAIAEYHRAIKLQPDYADAYHNLGNALYGQGKWEEAITQYRKALELKPDMAQAHTGLGLAFSKQGKVDDAIAACRKAILLKPKLADSYYGLGTLYLKLRRYDEAITEFRKGMQLKPNHNHPGVHLNFGNALQAQGQLDDAITEYRKAITLKPDDANAHTNLGNALGAQGKLDEAIAAHHKAIALKPDFYPAHNNLGNALLAQGKLDEAVAAHRKAIALQPDLAEAHNNLAAVYYQRGKVDEAIACCRKAIELKPDYALAHANLGAALLGKGRLDEAIAAFKEALRLQPNDAAPRGNLASALGRKAWELANPPDPKRSGPKRAVEMVKEAIELTPTSVLAWQYLGWVQYRAGNWKASIEALAKSCELQKGGDCGQWIVLSLAHGKRANEKALSEQERARHQAEARRWYDRAVKQIDSWSAPPRNSVGQAIVGFRQEAAELLSVKEKPK